MSDSEPEILNLPAKPGAMVRAVREQRGWTLAEVSERTGLSVSTLSKVENDKMSLTYDKLSRISKGRLLVQCALHRQSCKSDGITAMARGITCVTSGDASSQRLIVLLMQPNSPAHSTVLCAPYRKFVWEQCGLS